MKKILQHYKKIGIVLPVIMAILVAQKSSAQNATITFDYTGSTTTACSGDGTYSGSAASLNVATTGIPANATITAISFTAHYGVFIGTTNFTFTLNGTSIGVLSVTNSTCATGNIPSVNIALFNKTGPNTLAFTMSGGTIPGVFNGIFTVTYCIIPALPGGTNGSRCGTGTVNISATPGAGEAIDWYANPTGGTALATGTTSFTTPSIATTTIYYAEARNIAGGCVSATRRAVTATINGIPVTSVTNQSNIACFAGSDGSITIAVTGGTGPYFYSVNNGSSYTATASASPFSYGGLAANTQYRIRVKDSNGCESK